MTEVKLPTTKDPATEEKNRLLALIIREREDMVSRYKNTIKHTGSLLTESMTYAYSKGISDIIKLLVKEE